MLKVLRVTSPLAVAALVVGQCAIPASAAGRSGSQSGSAGWRVVKVIGPSRGNTDLFTITAAGRDDAWAAGILCDDACNARGSGDGGRTLLEHWNGRAWNQVAGPKGFSANTVDPVAGGATWFLGNVGSDQDRARVFSWNGGKWSSEGSPPCDISGFASDITAFSAHDAWEFSDTTCAARYDGRSWRRTSLPGHTGWVSAVSATDIWAVGVSAKTARKPAAQRVYLAMHWNGRNWRTTRLPKGQTPLPVTGMATTGPGIALGPRDLWVPCTSQASGSRVVDLLRWDGSHWRRVKIPYPAVNISVMTPDGRGGAWLVAYWGGPHFLRYDHGTWKQYGIPTSPAGKFPYFPTIAGVPGTRSAWGATFVAEHGGQYFRALILKFGNP